jgi:hypothetical protein
MNQAADGTLAELSTEERVRAGDLIAAVKAWAPGIGPNVTGWPGLTVYRFEAPSGRQWSEVRSLALCVVAQGRKAVTVDEARYVYDPFNYLVLHRGMRFESEILEASVEMPFLSLVLQIDPALVQRVSADMRDEYGGRLVNTTLWLGTNSEPTVGDMVEIAVTPGKPTSCRYVQGQSVAQGRFSHPTLDGTRFTVRTMGLDQSESTTQELCGYVNGLQVNIGVQVQALSRSRLSPGPLSSLTGTSGQNAAVSVFQHLTLLGPDPAGWTTHPLG